MSARSVPGETGATVPITGVFGALTPERDAVKIETALESSFGARRAGLHSTSCVLPRAWTAGAYWRQSAAPTRVAVDSPIWR